MRKMVGFKRKRVIETVGGERMTEKHKRFCEYYAECLNATEAAQKAGYSPKTAYSQGNRLLKDVEIVKYIKELQEKTASIRIADITEVKETWTSVLRDQGQKTRDRIRAGELLARSSGQFLAAATNQKTTKAAEEPEPDAEPDAEPEYAQIILPVIEGEQNFNAVQLQNGDVVPLFGHEHDDIWIYVPLQASEPVYLEPEDDPEGGTT
jgi:phage terminase small subunit